MQMQAISRLRLLKDLVGAGVLPSVALHSVASELISASGASRGAFRWQSFRYICLDGLVATAPSQHRFQRVDIAGLVIATWRVVLQSISLPGCTLPMAMSGCLLSHQHHT